MLSLTDEAHLSALYDSDEITDTIPETRSPKPLTLRIAAAAAVFALCVGGGLFLWQQHSRPQTGGSDTLTYPVQHTSENPGVATSTAEPVLAVGTSVEREDYILCFAEMTGYAEINSTLSCGGNSYPVLYPDLPFDTSGFSTFEGTVYCDEDGTPINTYLCFMEGVQQLRLYVSDNATCFSDAIIHYQPPENPENKPVMVMYYGSYGEEHILCVDLKHGGIQYTLKMANFTPEVVESYAAALLESGITSADFLRQTIDASEYFTDTAFFQSEDGGVEVQEYDLHGAVIETHDFPFALTPYSFGGMELFLRENGSPVHACIALTDEHGGNLNLFVDTRRYTFLTALLEGDGGVLRGDVRLFGSHPTDTVSQLCFRVHGVDFLLHGVGTDDADLVLLADEIINYVNTMETYTPETDPPIIRCPME